MHRGLVDLSGTWRATRSDDELRRSFADPGYVEPDATWVDAEVPGHWATTAGLEGVDGPVLYRHAFSADPVMADERAWLTLLGAFYQGDVWLDGSYLGDTEGYFAPHRFEVTAPLRDGDDHLLAVELTCAPQPDKRRKRNLTGVFQHWDCFDPAFNPGGLWQPVTLHRTGPVALLELRVRCTDASAASARLEVTARLDAATAGTVALRTVVDPGADSTEKIVEKRLAAGRNTVSWRVDVAHPRLWWPWALDPAGPEGAGGEGAALVDVVVEVTPLDGALSDRAVRRTGLRQVRRKGWVFEVNGERLFLKGVNQGPARMALGDAGADEVAADLVGAKAAGLDLVRVHGHIAPPALYDAADRLGLLVWQDLPLQWRYARGVRPQATRQATQAVELLAHHPSIALWCAHNDPLSVDARAADPADRTSRRSRTRRQVAGILLPTWNRTVLDTAVARALDKADGSRPVIAHSGVLPHPAWGTDSHLYLGWYQGSERDLPRVLRRLPVLGRFVSEFGAQALPTTLDFAEPDRWPDLDWDRLAATHNLQLAELDHHVPRADHATAEGWRDATQAYQADVLRFHIEHLRRLKYRPTGGFCAFLWADAHPSVSWSVLDHERVPKAGHAALVAACAPVLVCADRLDPTYAPGDAVALDVHVVNDRRLALSGCRVDARLEWEGAGEPYEWSFEGKVGADDVARVGTISFVVPDQPGPVRLHLALRGPAESSSVQAATVIGTTATL